MNIRLVGNAVTIMSNHLVILHEAREKKSSEQMFCLSYSPGAGFHSILQLTHATDPSFHTPMSGTHPDHRQGGYTSRLQYRHELQP